MFWEILKIYFFFEQNNSNRRNTLRLQEDIIVKKVIWLLVALLLLSVAGLGVLSACNKSNDETSIMLQQTSNSITVGIKDKQEWKFINDGKWIFDGVYVNGVRTFEIDDGAIFRFSHLSYNDEHPDTVIDSGIDKVTVTENSKDKKIVQVENSQCVMTLSVSKGNAFVKRDLAITSNCDNEIADYQLGFTLRTVDGLFERKDGAIATKNNSVSAAEIPYAYPAIYAQFYGEKNTTDLINIVDYNSTDFVVNNMRLRKVSDVFEAGACSGVYTLGKNDVVELHDYWYCDSRTNHDMYDLIGIMSEQMAKASPMAFDNLAYQGNMNVETFEQLCAGLYKDLSDDRCFINGAYVPYGYSVGWSESFATFDVLKGIVRYAKQIDNRQMYDDAVAVAKYILCNSGWVTKYDGVGAKDDEYFLYQSFDGKYSANSSGEETGSTPGISTWKYYDMMANVGEMALFTQDKDIIDGFLKLMPFFNSLVLDSYQQPVAWYYNTRQPAAGYDNGGSGGAAAIWGYVNLMASQLTDNSVQKTKWQQDGLASLQQANSLDFFQMHSIRVAVKSVSIGWAVRGNVYAYKLTNDANYMKSAQHIAQGIASFYYVNNNPYTFFTSYGYSYACTRERWEAYFETANALWLVTDVMEEMTDKTALLDLYYSSSRSHQWFFPINANPYGNYTGPLDSIDAHYIPFEFGTGVLGDDPGNEGGAQALLRQTKEIYGCGETFLEYLMFEAYGKSVDSRLLALCTTGATATFSNTQQNFVFYNPFENEITAPFVFRGFADGKYSVTVDGEEKGTFTADQMANGIAFTLAGRTAQKVVVKRVGDDSTENSGKVSVSATNITNSSATITATQGYDHYVLYVSKYPDFVDLQTQIIYSASNVFDIHFDDNSTLYVKAKGVDAEGNATHFSDVCKVEGLDAEVLAVESFDNGGALEQWTVTNGEAKSDFYSGQFYTSSDLKANQLVASRTMSVDASAKVFEIRFVTKNANSIINVKLSCNGKEVTAFDGIAVLQKGVMQFNLAESGLFNGLQGEQNVTVTIESCGKSRGFAISYIRFINITKHTDSTAFLNNEFSSQYCKANVENGALVIKNDSEQTVITEPSVDVLFDPVALPVWEIVLSGYRAIDTVRFVVTDENQLTVVDTGNVNVAQVGGKLTYNLVDDFNITQEGVYTFTYEVSNERVEITKMQLVGESSEKVSITKQNGVVDGDSAYINDNGEIRLKKGTIYNYGDVRKIIQVDMDNNPIVFFNISELKGSWSVKVIPEGSVDDVRLTPDNSQTGKIAFDLRSVISSTGKVNLTFVIFVIGAGAGDQNCYLKMDSIGFGNSLELVAEKTDEVISSVTYGLGEINLDNTPYLHINVLSLSDNASWKVYIVDNATGRSVELRNSIERKFNAKYNRTKIGNYMFDINEITGYGGVKDLSVKLVLIGNGAQANIADVSLSNNSTLKV